MGKADPRTQTEQKHPAEYQQDLNPDYKAGINFGTVGPEADKNAPSAYEIKEIHDRYPQLHDDDLKQIPVLPAGSRLQQGAVYIDLKAPRIEEFRAAGAAEAGPDNWYVPKDEVGYDLYNRLLQLGDS